MTTKFNTSIKQIDKNIKTNSKSNVVWLDELKHCIFTGKIAIVGGSPSLRTSIDELKKLKAKGVMIMSVNGSHDYLVDNGIEPDFFAMLDARKLNDFVNTPIKSCVYFLASQCHKDIFNKLKGSNVILWHCEYEEIDKEFIAKEAIKRKVLGNTLISGKGTIGLTSVCLAYTLGFREFLLYGMDSSFDEIQHSYEQSQNKEDKVVELTVGDKVFKTTPALAAQVDTYLKFKDILERSGGKMVVKSNGLLKAAEDESLKKDKNNLK